jgi:hypothetical protein
MVMVAAACSSGGTVTANGSSGGTSTGGSLPGGASLTGGAGPGGTGGASLTGGSGGQPATGGGPASGGQANGTGGASLGGSTGSSATGGAATGCAPWIGLGNCVTQSTAATLATTNLLLLLDRSGTMESTPAGLTGTKWDAMRSAFSSALNMPRFTLNFGLDFFPAANVARDCTASACCAVPAPTEPLTVPIGPGSDTVPTILSALDATSPGGGTPIAAALARALDYYTTGDGRNLKGDRYVLLVTDGGPNCNGALSCTADTCTRNLDGFPECSPTVNCCSTAALAINCLDDRSVINEIQALASAGIWTIVVAMPGSDPYAQYLDQFAVAGGHTNPMGPPYYYAVPSSAGVQGLADTLQTIIRDLVTHCGLVVDPPPVNPALFNLAVDCQAVTASANDADGGWTLDLWTVTLTGAVCDRIMNGTVTRVDYLLGCPTLP